MLDYETETATITIALSGGYDLMNKQSILDQVAAVLPLQAVQAIALDMSQVTFLDSTALGALIRASRICRSQGKRLTIPLQSKPVERLLRVTRTHGIFQ